MNATTTNGYGHTRRIELEGDRLTLDFWTGQNDLRGGAYRPERKTVPVDKLPLAKRYVEDCQRAAELDFDAWKDAEAFFAEL